ncbi:MAG: MFS transporter, partial [Clostridia bacterium]|nr:MFS transporter [Clostridia bacterium]
VADVIDFQEYTTHIKSESAIYAVYTFCRKLGQTAADYGGLMLLGKIGYNADTMANAGFVPGVSEGILKVCTIIPAITYTLIFLLYVLFPLTKERLEPVYSYIRSNNAKLTGGEAESETAAE